MDFYPTVLDILQIKKPKQVLDGQSLLPVLRGKTLPERPLYWHFPVYLEAYDPQTDDGRDPLFRTRPGSAIRLGNWKLHEFFEDGGLELYNLCEDISERNNLALTHPQQVKKLQGYLNHWRNQTQAPIPYG
ncbi:hypothetical protein BH24BAC1_BH24BAC1_32180 [soil metagenome]